MNVKFSGIVLVLVMSFCGSAHAQDKALSPSESVDTNHGESTVIEDKISIGEPEVKSRIVRDSLMLHNKGVSSPGHKSKAIDAKVEEDDAMSFNFLYYIIQKFKFSDLIDE